MMENWMTYSHRDMTNQIATFHDIDEAIHFRRQFPHWEVRCLLVFPRHQQNGRDKMENTPLAQQVVAGQPVLQIKQVPSEITSVQRPTIDLAHPLLDVPATADVFGLWQENGRVLGLELYFPDGHRSFLTFEEIQELQNHE